MDFSENHTIFFRNLTGRALTQSSLSDKDLLLYLSDLLIDFMYIDHLYRLRDEKGRPLEYIVDMLMKAEAAVPHEKKSHYKQIGDYSLFLLGMFPESLSRGKRMIPQSYYADAGKRSYITASELEGDSYNTTVFRKLAEKFEGCVLSLHWVREYSHDPFYQYMFRQFGVT
ncbi:MAG: hypothetical protein HY645_08110 [Acidobacteria bacterium]|nr:hypothetical protein [Acidobacteriota bacterium]